VDDGTATPTNYDPKLRGPRQKESWNQWAENKAVYAVRRDLLMETGCRIGGRVGYVEMSKRDSIDIDRPEDFELAEAVLASRRS
jgi:N-acylneuraminate cytidylyltransferase